MVRRYPLRRFASSIDKSRLGFYFQGQQVEVLHSDRSPSEKRAALEALAALARDLAPFWVSHDGLIAALSPNMSMRVWFLCCGLAPSGQVDPTLLARVEEIERHA